MREIKEIGDEKIKYAIILQKSLDWYNCTYQNTIIPSFEAHNYAYIIMLKYILSTKKNIFSYYSLPHYKHTVTELCMYSHICIIGV